MLIIYHTKKKQAKCFISNVGRAFSDTNVLSVFNIPQ